MVRLTASTWEVFSVDDAEPLVKHPQRIEWDVQAAQKGGHKHFMIKEIFEQPQVIADCLTGRLVNDAQGNASIRLPELDGHAHALQRIHIVACGTSYHAGLWGMYLLERWAGIPVQVEIASEFRYRKPILDKHGLVLAISQSGETADTLAGIQLAKEHGLPVMGMCNVVGSSVARESDRVLYTQAGPEISVASTKAMCSQLTALLLLALYWGQAQPHLWTTRPSTAAPPSWPTCRRCWKRPCPTMRSRAQELALDLLEAWTASCTWAGAPTSPWPWRARSSSRRSPTSTPRATRPGR